MAPGACKLSLTLLLLHAAGSYPGLIYMQLATKQQQSSALLAAGRILILHALEAITAQSHQFFARTLQKQLFELKKEEAPEK